MSYQANSVTSPFEKFSVTLSIAESLDDCTPANTFFHPEPVTMIQFLEYAASDPYIRHVSRGIGKGRWLCQIRCDDGSGWVDAWFQLIPMHLGKAR